MLGCAHAKILAENTVSLSRYSAKNYIYISAKWVTIAHFT